MYKEIPRVQALPPTSGVTDPETRKYLEAVTALLNQRSGLINKQDGNRFITLDEFGGMASKAIVQAFAPGVAGGAIGVGLTPGGGIGTIGGMIDMLAKSIMESLAYKSLGVPITAQDIDHLQRNLDKNSQVARAGITKEELIRTGQVSAMASAINNIWAQIGGTSAVIDDGALATVTPSTASASKWSAVVAAVTDPNTGKVNSTAIKQDMVSYADKTNNKFSSLYTVKAQVSVDGRTLVGGIALAATQGDGLNGPGSSGPNIDFGVRADRFFIAGTVDTGDANAQLSAGSSVPFMVLTRPQMVNGTLYPIGVYIKKALIGDLSVDTLKIAGNAVTLPFFASFGAVQYGATSYQYLEANSRIIATVIYTVEQPGFHGANIQVSARDSLGNVYAMGSSGFSFENFGNGVVAGSFITPYSGWWAVGAQVGGEASCTSMQIVGMGAQR